MKQDHKQMPVRKGGKNSDMKYSLQKTKHHLDNLSPKATFFLSNCFQLNYPEQIHLWPCFASFSISTSLNVASWNLI